VAQRHRRLFAAAFRESDLNQIDGRPLGLGRGVISCAPLIIALRCLPTAAACTPAAAR